MTLLVWAMERIEFLVALGVFNGSRYDTANVVVASS